MAPKLAAKHHLLQTRRRESLSMSASPARIAQPTLKSQLLEDLAPPALKAVLDAATARKYLAHSVIVNQREPADKFFMLLEGRARFFYVTPEGRKILFPWIVPGEVFGAASVARAPKDPTYLCSTETLEESRVLVWNRTAMRELATCYPILLDNLFMISRTYIDWFFGAHIALSCHNARYRLAHVIVNVARSIGHSVRGGVEIEITNDELAGAANVTPFTASRLLSEWQRRGALTKSRGKILLRSSERLFMSPPEPCTPIR